MEKKYLSLNNIASYKKAFYLSNYVWKIVTSWNLFAQKTVGIQFVNAVDSISANIAEGFGRYGKKDKVKFYYYSFGSVKESLDWNEKAEKRKLLQMDEYQYILKELKNLPKEIHYLIKFTNDKLKD